MARRSGHFTVSPRYTAGSPGVVDADTASRVVVQEARGHELALAGLYGPEKKQRAATLGLEGIVEYLEQRHGGWYVEDMLTGRTCRRLEIKASGIHIGDRVLAVKTGLSSLDAPVDVAEVLIATKSVVVAVRPSRPGEPRLVFLKSDRVQVEREA